MEIIHYQTDREGGPQYNRDLRISLLKKYTDHGGKFFIHDSIYPVFNLFAIDLIPHCVFDTLEPWLVDDLSPFHICLIGTLAHVDAEFCSRLKKELASYRSPASPGPPSFADHLFEITFGMASIKSHFHTLGRDQMSYLLALLCKTGSASMMKLFLEIGVSVEEDDSTYSLLGHAAAAGNKNVVRMLLEAGANGSLAIVTFLRNSEHLSDALFRHYLQLLIDNARPTAFDISENPLLEILMSRRALCHYSRAPEILLDRKIFTRRYLGDEASEPRYSASYMFQAILTRNPFVVDLLLRNGARADAQISHLFRCSLDWLGPCTWITFSVMYGAASCTDALIRYGADVTALDGNARSALQLAQVNASTLHPRTFARPDRWKYEKITITAEEDAQTLAVVERAFNDKYQGKMRLDDYISPSKELPPQPPSRRGKPVSALQKTLEKALRMILTPTQIEHLHYHLRVFQYEIRGIWSLSFYEILLMCFIYALSYALLLAIELHAFIKGHKRIPMASRTVLSAVAFLALALIWGSPREWFS